MNDAVNFNIDIQPFIGALRSLEPRKLNRVLKNASKKAAGSVVSEVKKTLKSRVGSRVYSSVGSGRNPKKLFKGIGYGSFKRNGTRKINIMGEYRLKWFEKGTNDRFARKYKGRNLNTPRYTGKMTGKYFFRDTINNGRTESLVNEKINESISRDLDRIFNRR